MADPKLSELTAEAKALNKELETTRRLLGDVTTAAGRTSSSFGNLRTSLKSTGDSARSANNVMGATGTSRGTGLPTPSQPDTVWSRARSSSSVFSEVRDAGGSTSQSLMSAGRYVGGGGGGGGLLGGTGASIIGAITKASDIYGSLVGSGLQMAYNRIEGPTGNRNTVLQIAQALSPNAGMMGMSVDKLLAGLSQRTPVLGSNADIIGTILAGQSVGAFMSGQGASAASGIPGRSGFFESVRQMQLLTPGVGAGSMATTLSNYLGNTQAQQMGMYLGQGAFSMVGKGGSYKSLAEWSDAILKFLSQQRPGGAQGTKFSKEELMSQNFPGSNINAWFRMMGVPQDMVDYWWQYALANADKTNPVAQGLFGPMGPMGPAGQMGGPQSQTEILQYNINQTRGTDLGYERLRSVTQGARRDYLLGQQMYGLYNVRESADRRFNVAMQSYDEMMGQFANTTNLGAAMALLPTPIMELLMPMLSRLASSPVGTALSAVGAVKNAFGDPPVGDYGELGATNTAHLSPGLSGRVNAMMRANPRLRITSGYRDTVTQNRLHKNGVGRVGPASKSAHTRGWAVDIGPTSELAWVQANAGKYGLQTASHAGEPWHLQMAGTMPVGDFPIGDIGFDTIPGGVGWALGKSSGLGGGSGVAGLFDLIGGDIFKGILDKFITGGGISSLIDTAISWFIKAMTAPIGSLASVFGNRSALTDSEINTMVNRSSSVKVEASKWSGFTPYNRSSSPGFGDPISMASQPASVNARFESPIIFKTEIHISGNTGSSPADIYKTANSMADALEDVLAKRQWRKS